MKKEKKQQVVLSKICDAVCISRGGGLIFSLFFSSFFILPFYIQKIYYTSNYYTKYITIQTMTRRAPELSYPGLARFAKFSATREKTPRFFSATRER
jgi:hypothetical protein